MGFKHHSQLTGSSTCIRFRSCRSCEQVNSRVSLNPHNSRQYSDLSRPAYSRLGIPIDPSYHLRCREVPCRPHHLHVQPVLIYGVPVSKLKYGQERRCQCQATADPFAPGCTTGTSGPAMVGPTTIFYREKNQIACIFAGGFHSSARNCQIALAP
jgi:hypothetical protein